MFPRRVVTRFLQTIRPNTSFPLAPGLRASRSLRLPCACPALRGRAHTSADASEGSRSSTGADVDRDALGDDVLIAVASLNKADASPVTVTISGRPALSTAALDQATQGSVRCDFAFSTAGCLPCSAMSSGGLPRDARI